MNRRQLFLTAAALSLSGLAAVSASPVLAAPIRTRWTVSLSEGFDALCFLGPLSGKDFYARYYKDELAQILPRMPKAAMAAMASLQAEADKESQLLGPGLCTLMSGGPTETLDAVIAALDAAETALLPAYKASAYWDAKDWDQFVARRPRLRLVLDGLRQAGFPDLRRRMLAPTAETRLPALRQTLAGYDVIAEQERLLGRSLDASLEIVLLWFNKPHGIRVQGQRFITGIAWPDEIVLRNAAHEVLHPPFPMDGPAAKAALAVLEKDALLTRIVAEHDPAFGYNSLEGLLNEDMVEALEQIVSERLGFAVEPHTRWEQADDGMHVLAAGLYGLLKADGYDRTGGDIEAWTIAAARSGKLSPASLHAKAAEVTRRPVDQLWPLKKA
ncbi:hypothetical protein [Caulobacter segnis]|uniref:hypothetical protein n=1 Tax=Caulobacter segnis TaxID=88688 RepID=UPI001CC00E1B|nr:hypothetical protein [Caulobacter segnis]UAL12062.1 hypothetical protein K8940_07235 [Caulobacter segnis]